MMPTPQTPPPQRADDQSVRLLQACGEIALAQFMRAAVIMFDHADEALFELAEKSFDRTQYNEFLEARAFAKHQRDFVLNGFKEAFWRAFDAHLHEPVEPKQSFEFLRVDSQSLSLVANDEVEESLVVSRLAKTLDGQGGTALLDFQARLRSVLPLADGEQPLLSPLMVLQAFQTALDQIQTTLPIKKILFQQFQQSIQLQIAPMYQGLNQKLESAHIPLSICTPAALKRLESASSGAVRTPKLADSQQTDPAVGQEKVGVDLGQISGKRLAVTDEGSDNHFFIQGEVGVPPDLWAQLEALNQAAPQGFLQDTALLSLLSKSHDRLVLDMVSFLFDYVMGDADIPPSVRQHIASLQLPILKIALQDAHGFADKQHPTRLCVDSLARLGQGLTRRHYSTDLPAKLTDLLQPPPASVEAFAALSATLQQWLLYEETMLREREEAQEKQRFEEERKALCKLAARRALHQHLMDYVVPLDLRKQLVRWWGIFLAEAFAAGGSNGIHWRMGLSALDEVVASIQPKNTLADRQALAQALPALIQKIELIFRRHPEAQLEKQQFLALLLQHHMRLLKPEDRLMLPPPIIVMQTPPAETHINTYEKESKPKPLEAPAETGDLLDQVVRGAWVVFVDKAGHQQLMKLAWSSPMRGMFLFTNKQGQNAINIEAEDLRRQFQQGRALLQKE